MGGNKNTEMFFLEYRYLCAPPPLTLMPYIHQFCVPTRSLWSFTRKHTSFVVLYGLLKYAHKFKNPGFTSLSTHFKEQPLVQICRCTNARIDLLFSCESWQSWHLANFL